MSSRPLLQPAIVIGGNSGVSGSMATSITSLVTVLSNMSMMSYEYTWVGTTPVGTISVQVSNDYAQNVDGTVKTPGNWATLPLSSSTAVSGDTGTGFVDIDQLGAYAIRTVYTASSGTGSLTATFKGKSA